MYKKIISLLTILSMTLVLFTGVPISVSAEQSGDGWSLDDDGKLTVTTNDGTTAWRDTISDKTTVTSVDIKSGVTSIGENAFRGCSNLTSVDIPNSVDTIGVLVFNNCTKLKSVNIPNDVTIINSATFQSCENLETVTIPEKVEYIYDYAFNLCKKLKTVFYPDTCEVYISAFNNTTATQIKYNVNGGKLTITDIIPNGDTTTVDIGKMDGDYSTMTADTIIYKSGLTVSGDIVSAATTKIEYTENDGKITISKIIAPDGVKAEIPAKINDMDVVAVAEDYQDKVDTTKHTTHTYVNGSCTICGSADPNAGNDDGSDISWSVEDSTLTISGTGALDDLSAFDGDKESITEVVIEDGITSVGDGAFDGFTSLETVYYPQDTAVGGDAFPEDVTQVEYSVDEDGVVIENIILGSGVSEGDKVVIPDKIGGKDVVAVDEDVRDLVSPDEGHTHNYENGKCTICGADDESGEPVVSEPPVSEPTVSEPTVSDPAVTDPTGTSPAAPPAPSRPSAPSVPSNPASPAVTTAAETTTVTVTTAEEIIADNDYTGEDVSAGAGDDSDDGGITDMSMFVILLAIAAVISAAVLVKKIVF